MTSIASAPTPIGRQAIVIGAGIGGLAAAGALAPWFQRVIVVERDRLAEAASPRAGAPQGWHTHVMLAGGQRALEELFPGLSAASARAGGVLLRGNLDLREELPDGTRMPQRDFGISVHGMSRALCEFTLRQHLAHHANVVIRHGARVVKLLTDADGRRVTGVACIDLEGVHIDELRAELVVDASGRGQPTMALLLRRGAPPPRETVFGIDLSYSTAVFDIPDDAPTDWKVVITHNNADRTRRGIMLPIERNRWLLSVVGRGGERPPGEWDALLDYLRGLNTDTIYNAVRKASPVGGLTRFGFPDSYWRHFDELDAFPDGLIPLGDAISRFNPIYGQGMAVAALEARVLHRLLAARAAHADPLTGLGAAFFNDSRPLIEAAWTMSAIPDLLFPSTRGERPANFDQALLFRRALTRLAQRDEAVNRVLVDVWHMLRPRSAYQEPWIKAQIEDEMRALSEGALAKA